ncbi:glycosyl hydrolase family 61 [Pyrenophora seminiperda CCB06]|uniref:Glycosyl hydrolase family 61 n=1 Tax=Pyrenophora seminiperda CCB06 TaxID=1302712 RepID=A0A3M7M5R5_9PLEO|nr:glycosyl hydrolase family 61 [Pyrenophora seminiperda CCB06]
MQLLTIAVLGWLMDIASAHGHVSQITTSTGEVYKGWDPESSSSLIPPSPLAAWSAANLGNIYVSPSQFNTTNITCHYNAVPGALHINTTAGDTLNLHWNEWPKSHVGPVLTYLAACNGSCAHAKKEELEWVKIDELAWLNSTDWSVLMLGGTWATDILIANNFSWTTMIPPVLASGNYVLRHEIIALHAAEQLDGAQAYPQCVNLHVSEGNSTAKESLKDGILGNKLYGMKAEGILVDVHKKMTGYKLPGPKLWKYAMPLRQPNQ